MKLCECGCGKPAPIAKQTITKIGHKKGQPIRFILGHHRNGANSSGWKGGITKKQDGRVLVFSPNHYKSYKYVQRSIYIAEKVFGKPLPSGAVVHHANCDHTNDKNNNLVICQDQGYHLFLHQRKRAYEASGNPSWRKCAYCKKYDAPDSMDIYVNKATGYDSVGHKHCRNKHNREYRRKRRALRNVPRTNVCLPKPCR